MKAQPDTSPESRSAARALVLPLALAQFIASYAATNMNVAISTIAEDLHTTVIGVQTAITLFTLTMAALMIPGSKLSDLWGRKRCFIAGLIVYGAGALLAAMSQGLGLLKFGYSLLEGVGSALMIPPIYILVTVAFADIKTRARYFGVVSAAAGLGAAAGPLIGGLITSAISWRVSFLLQVVVVGIVIVMARKIVDPPRTAKPPRFDVVGSVLSGAALFFVVFGILQTGTYGWLKSREDYEIGNTVLIHEGGISPFWLFAVIGVVFLILFIAHVRRQERIGRTPLLPSRLLRQRTSNLGLMTQISQWLVMQGSFFVISVYLQELWGYNAIQTGLMLMPATFGILVASAAAERLAARWSQRSLVIGGFAATAVGMLLLLLLVRENSPIIAFVPGLLAVGLGVGVMLTASVNIVQSAWPEDLQGDISGLSRSVSNLGSSLGTALAGSVLVAAAAPGGRPFAVAIIVMGVATLLGLAAAIAIKDGKALPEANAGGSPARAGTGVGT